MAGGAQPRGLGRSMQTSFWTPCEKGKVSLSRPKRLTRIEECMIDKYNVGIPVIKCLNWKTMSQSNAHDCIAECQGVLRRAKKWPAKKKMCENDIANQEDRARGGCKKGKKCKKGNGKKNDDDDDEEANDNDEPEPTTETLDNDNGLMFDDDFDATDAPLQAPDRLSMMEAPLFDDFSEGETAEKPLFEDVSESDVGGGLGLFDDSVNETKSDSQARLELAELTIQHKPKGGNKKKKGKKGKKPVNGRRG